MSGPRAQSKSQVNYNELELQFKSISSNFIGWICLQDLQDFYLAWLCLWTGPRWQCFLWAIPIVTYLNHFVLFQWQITLGLSISYGFMRMVRAQESDLAFPALPTPSSCHTRRGSRTLHVRLWTHLPLLPLLPLRPLHCHCPLLHLSFLLHPLLCLLSPFPDVA